MAHYFKSQVVEGFVIENIFHPNASKKSDDILRFKIATLVDYAVYLFIFYIFQEQYFPQLAQDAKIKEVPAVIYSLFRYVANSMKTEPLDYRKIKYKIIDHNTFTTSVVD